MQGLKKLRPDWVNLSLDEIIEKSSTMSKSSVPQLEKKDDSVNNFEPLDQSVSFVGSFPPSQQRGNFRRGRNNPYYNGYRRNWGRNNYDCRRERRSYRRPFQRNRWTNPSQSDLTMDSIIDHDQEMNPFNYPLRRSASRQSVNSCSSRISCGSNRSRGSLRSYNSFGSTNSLCSNNSRRSNGGGRRGKWRFWQHKIRLNWDLQHQMELTIREKRKARSIMLRDPETDKINKIFLFSTTSLTLNDRFTNFCS